MSSEAGPAIQLDFPVATPIPATLSPSRRPRKAAPQSLPSPSSPCRGAPCGRPPLRFPSTPPRGAIPRRHPAPSPPAPCRSPLLYLRPNPAQRTAPSSSPQARSTAPPYRGSGQPAGRFGQKGMGSPDRSKPINGRVPQPAGWPMTRAHAPISLIATTRRSRYDKPAASASATGARPSAPVTSTSQSSRIARMNERNSSAYAA